MPVRLAAGAIAKWLGGGTLVALLALAGGWAYHEYQTKRLERELATFEQRYERLEHNRNRWQQSAQQWQQQHESLRIEYEASRLAVRELNEALRAREARYVPVLDVVEQSPPEDDGEVAPVLRQALEGLQ